MLSETRRSILPHLRKGPCLRALATSYSRQLPGAFTLIELLVVMSLLTLAGAILVPALARTRGGSQTVQCLNNLRQMASAWKMYADDNASRIVSAYPTYGAFTATWCAGDAESGGGAGSYTYGGADPRGIQSGLLWPYTRTLGLYHCPTDHRIADGIGVPAEFKGRPILRSISMNSCMDGTSFGINPTWVVTNPTGARNPTYPVYIKDTEMRQPKQTWVLADEDPDSINDGMLLMDLGGSRRFLDLPSRAHAFAYSICLADGHTELIQLRDQASKDWHVGGLGGVNDWRRLKNLTTHPL